MRLCVIFPVSVSPHVVRPGRWSDGYPGAGGASAVTISQSLIGMKRATQSASLQAGRPIIPTDISFKGTHAGNPSSDLHGLASLTGTCPPECCFSDAYSESSGACRERRIYIYRDIPTKGFMFMSRILFRSALWGFVITSWCWNWFKGGKSLNGYYPTYTSGFSFLFSSDTLF